MKKGLLKFGMLLLFVLLAATKGFSQTNDELKAKIEAINKQMESAMLTSDMEKSLSFYTADAISLPEFGKMREGIDAIRAAETEEMKSASKVTSVEFVTLKVSSCENLVTEIGSYKITLTVPGKPDPINDQGKYLTVWEKQPDGSLKVKVETWNTDINPMAMNKM